MFVASCGIVTSRRVVNTLGFTALFFFKDFDYHTRVLMGERAGGRRSLGNADKLGDRRQRLGEGYWLNDWDAKNSIRKVVANSADPRRREPFRSRQPENRCSGCRTAKFMQNGNKLLKSIPKVINLAHGGLD